MTRHKRNHFSAEQFAERFASALESNPNAPPKFHGERVWLVEQLLKHGLTVTPETVRKWLNGQSMPTHDKVPILADVLGVDADWMLYGDESSNAAKARVAHNVDASAATNLVAGIIQMSGATVHFPAPKVSTSTHLNAVIGKVNYPLHIVVGDELDGVVEAVVPVKSSDAVILCVVPHDDAFAYDIYEIEEGLLNISEVGRGGRIVRAPAEKLKKIESFKERL